MRLVPQSLAGRLALVVMAVLAGAQLLSLAIHMHERGELLAHASGLRVAQQIADVVDLFEATRAPERRRIAQVMSRPPFVVSLDRAPLEAARANADERTRAALFAALLRRTLGGERTVTVRVTEGVVADRAEPGYPPRGPVMGAEGMPESGPRGPGMGMGMGARWMTQPGVLLIAQVRLADGTLVTFESGQPAETAHWPYRLLASLAVLLVAAIVASVIAVRWATRPLATLAAAAGELGRNVHRPPLDERGPREVADAARAFNTMQAQLAEYLASRTRLLAAMSHDLKTPITRLRLRSELLDDPRLREKYETDLAELEAMVASTLEFLRGMESEEPVQPIDFDALLETLQADRAETGAQVTIEGRTVAPFAGQRRALRRLFGNLLDNAIQYGGRAHVLVEDSALTLSVRVTDDGPGLPPGELEKVFEPFYRVEASRSRETGGTGLGLPIARQIARAHGGEVTLANRPRGGLEAKVALPRHASR